MAYLQPSSFPDPNFLRDRAQKMFEVLLTHHGPEEAFVVLSDALLQWQGAYITDRSMGWEKTVLRIDDLYLTGMDAEWNKIVIDQCRRSPRRLRQLATGNPEVGRRLSSIEADQEPIMVRTDWTGKLAVLDGMNRLLSAIGRQEVWITAFVCRSHGPIKLQVAPGIAYSFCRAYRQGALDFVGLVTVLRIMRRVYGNMETLLTERFRWEPDLVPALEHALEHPYRPSLRERLRLFIRRWLR